MFAATTYQNQCTQPECRGHSPTRAHSYRFPSSTLTLSSATR
jgi:hypothetical protein